MEIKWKVVAINPEHDLVTFLFSCGASEIAWGVRARGETDVAKIAASDPEVGAYFHRARAHPNFQPFLDKEGDFIVPD